MYQVENITTMHQKAFLVSGVTGGIGSAVARDLLQKGFFVAGILRDLKRLQSEFRDNNKFEAIVVDLAVSDNLDNILDDLVCRHGKLDGFIHCAGIEETLSINMHKKDIITKIFQVNVFSAIELLRVVSKKRISNDGASIILVASVMAELGAAGKLGYCGSKSALIGLVKSASLELAKRRIRVNAVSPGIVLTDLVKSLFDKLAEVQKQDIVNMHPLGLGNVESVSGLISFLLSDESKWITGQNLIVDGGYSAH